MLVSVFSGLVPIFIIIVIIFGMIEKLDVFSLFVDGVNEGLRVTIKILPSVMAITIAISLLNETMVMEYIMAPISNVIYKLKIPQAIIPLVILRPLSGSASTSVVMDIFTKFGADSIEGMMASIIMASSETTFYVIAVLLGSAGIKKARGTTIAAITADVAAVILTVIIVNMKLNY